MPYIGNTTSSFNVDTNNINDGAVTPAKLSRPLTLETAKTATGTSVDFTGIPSWVKRITVMFNGVSTNGGAHLLVQIGAGSATTTGYQSIGGATGGSDTNLNGLTSTAGFLIRNGELSASNLFVGQMTLATLGAGLWVSCHTAASGASVNRLALGSGSITLSGTLDRLRLTTTNGTDTFDAGSINILYE